MDVEATRDAWLNCGIGEVDAWCRHIAKKVRHVIEEERDRRMADFDRIEVLADACIVIERLAHIHYRTANQIGQRRIVAYIAEVAQWPEHVALALWRQVRNPTVHLGRVNSFSHSSTRHEGVLLFGEINPTWSWRGPGYDAEGRAAHDSDVFDRQGRGWWSLPGSGLDGPPSWQKGSVLVTFWISAILDLMGLLRGDAIRALKAADEEHLRQLIPLNIEVPFMFCQDDPPGTLQELDLSDVMH